VTLQDVADRAGVSLTTASRVVNEGSRRVGPGLAQRVNQAVAELGYTANLQARAVATGQSTMIGVVVHDIADPYFSSIAAGLIEAAEARQLLVCMSSTAATEAAEREYVALMRAQRALAVILIGSRTDDTAAREALRAEIAAFTRSGGRAVAVGQDLLGVDTVLPENAAGAEALARAMVALGHRRFAVLAGPRGLLIIHPEATSAEPMGGATLGRQFGTDACACLLVAFLISQLSTKARYLCRVGVAATAGFLSAWVICVPYWNWYGFPGNFVLAQIADRTIGFTLAGLVMAAIVKPPKTEVTTPATATSAATPVSAP